MRDFTVPDSPDPIVAAVQENTKAVNRLADALEDFNALYSVVNHVQDVHSDLLATHE